MRKWALWLIVAGMSVPALAANRVTVEQLEKVLAGAKANADTEVAKQLAGMELTERLSSAKLEQLRVNMPGERSRQSLTALADASAFLAPPVSDIPATATPDAAAQHRMMGMTVNYLGKTLPLLPNLFAARDTMRFESRPAQYETLEAGNDPLHEASKSRVTVLYRNGHEFIDAGTGKDKKALVPDRGLTTWGEFGPILGTVVLDAAHSRLAWSHWELSAGGPQAVFNYSVPKDKSHYDVRFCCVTESFGFDINMVTERVGYHGEITVDPDSGTILRLTAVADTDSTNPIGRADIAVEYGPVAIGGTTYYLPVRGIALARTPDLKALHSGLNPPPAAPSGGTLATLQKASLSSIAHGPLQLLLNDVAFREYHLFRAESRVVAGDEAASQPSSTLPSAAAASQPAESTAVDASMAAPEPSAPTTLAMAVPPAAVAAEPPPEPSIPEISISPATGVPDAPALSHQGTDSAFTLRLNARLVDVPLVALDKKGHTLTNLKPEDLQIFDNGVKVDLSSFAKANGGVAPEAAPSGSATAEHSERPAYSNRGTGSAKAASAAPQTNTIVLLIDQTLSFDDLTNVREQMIRFLNGLHPDEPAGVFAMKVGRFQILQAPTTDHALLSATLAKWRPSAQSISLGQEQEARNRQTLETVTNPESLLNVNGLTQTDPAINQEALDPALRTLGDRPGASALSGLTDVARHLAAIPGHKSLVWIASDNVLADWTNSSINIDKGDKFIDAAALRTQEAMNNAHVSVYPLDASRLEASGVDASIGRRNVELTPTYIIPPMMEKALEGPEMTSGKDVNAYGQQRDLRPGRIAAQLQQDMHPIQGVYRELADATGGRVFRRSSDIVGEFNSVADDGRATYLLSFTPAQAADDKYHLITAKIAGRKDVSLRYRSGYFYRKEPSTVKDRFKDAVLQTEDASEIALTANPLAGSKGHTVKLAIGATDLEVAQKEAFWTDRLDVYVVRRDVSGVKAEVTGQTMGLRLKPATYQQYLREGVPFNQVLEAGPGVGSIRIVVVDENSGRMGSVTIPASAIGKEQ